MAERNLAALRVDVRAGSRTTIPVELGGSYEFVGGGLHGELVLPVDAKSSDLRLLAFEDRLSKNSKPSLMIRHRNMDEIRSGVLAWKMNDLTPGRYQLVLEPYAIAVDVVVEPGQDRLVQIDFADVALVQVWPTKDDGNAIAAPQVTWRAVALNGRSGWKTVSTSREAVQPRFACAAGSIEIICRASGFRTVRWTTDVAPGTNDVAVAMSPAGRYEIEIELRHGGSALPVSPEFWSGIDINGSKWPDELQERSLTGVRDGRGTSLDVASATLVMDRAGEYALDFPAIDGFAQIPRTSAVFPDGDRHVVVQIELVELH